MTPFVPHPLIPNGQMQTVAAILGKPPSPPRHTAHEYLPLADGDRLLLFIDRPEMDDGHKPLILLMHGLGGSGSSSYILRHSYHLCKAGFTVVRFNHRGCGPTHLDQARDIYHSGRTADLHAAIKFIELTWPGRQSGVIGYSMSGNILLRYLGAGTHPIGEAEAGARPPLHLSQALAICPPIDLESCSLALATLRNWHIHRYLIHHVTKQAANLEARRTMAERITLPRGTDLRTFDQIYTAPRAGFASRDDYYSRCSAKDVLSKITVPTTILAAKDDPIVPASIFSNVDFSPQIRLRLESAGGHLGFISRDVTDLGDRRWMDAEVVAWAQRLA